MEHGSGNVSFFDITIYAYWKICMYVYLQNISAHVWDNCLGKNYEVLEARVGQDRIDHHDANRKAQNPLFAYLCLT